MAEIIFDAFHPEDACLQAPSAAVPDRCRITAGFHLRGETTPGGATLSFRREKDRFVLETAGNEAEAALVRGHGFNEAAPALQSALFYSVALHQWVRRSHELLTPVQRQAMPWFLPLFARLRNFLVAGAVERPDPEQRAAAAKFLREVLDLPPAGQKLIGNALKILQTSNKSFIVPEMRPRIHWLDALQKAAGRRLPDLSALRAEDPLRGELARWYKEALVYLGTGLGQPRALQSELDRIVLQVIGRSSKLLIIEDLYGIYLGALEPLSSNPAFSGKEAESRLQGFLSFLRESFEERRAELLALGRRPEFAEDTLRRSVSLRLTRAGRNGDLGALVPEEAAKGAVPLEWLRRRENLHPVAEAVAQGLELRRGPEGPRIRVDAGRIRAALKELGKTRSLQRAGQRLAALAMLRLLFGNSAEAGVVRAWVKDRYADVALDWEGRDRAALSRLQKSLERGFALSFRRPEALLPWMEGGLCAAGLGIGGAGIGVDRRELTVSGSTVAGLGCGALITHFLFRRRHRYVADSIGGGLGAGVGFGLSWFLTGRKAEMRNPPMPPPPRDPERRHQVDPYGP